MADKTAEFEAMQAEIARLKAENADFARAARAVIKAKVGDKGHLILDGFRGWPITRGYDEIEAVLDDADVIRKFIADHRGELKPAAVLAAESKSRKAS